MTLQTYLGVLRRRWVWLAVAVLAGLLVAGVASSTATRLYSAKAGVFFSLEYGESASSLAQGSSYLQGQVSSYALLADTPAVLQPVIDDLDLDRSASSLAGAVTASVVSDTVVVEIEVVDDSAEQAALVANAVAEQLRETIDALAPVDAEGSPAVRATTVAPASVPGAPVSPNTRLDLAVGILGGLLAGCVLAVGRDALDNRVRDADVVAEMTSLSVLGSIPTYRADSPVVVEADPHGPTAEAFRHLRTNLQFVDLSEPVAGGRVLTVTSSLPGEGKSTVAINLAAALAEDGGRVLLVDADLRRPTLAKRLGLEGAAGLTTVLLGRASVDAVAQEWGGSGMRVLPAGPLPPNPTGLLGSPAMTRLVQQLRTDYDHVVLDVAPLLPVSDAAILSRSVDGTIVLANVTRVRRPDLRDGLQSLTQVDARVLGVVLNQVRPEREAYGYRPEDDVPDTAGSPGIAPTERTGRPLRGGPDDGSAPGRAALSGTTAARTAPVGAAERRRADR